jgi:hypothetical protein
MELESMDDLRTYYGPDFIAGAVAELQKKSGVYCTAHAVEIFGRNAGKVLSIISRKSPA